ncbi:MAG: hypothetical protein WAN17_07840 [Candidatus Sulfotelmatobacter sp.]
MSVRNALVLFLALSTLSLLVGCGSSSNSATPPPTGGFTTSSLSGTYVFSLSGTDVSGGNESFFAIAGTLVASGGSFSSGSVIDINDPAMAAFVGANSSVQPSLPATGSYSISADGRGTGTIDVTINSEQVQIGIDFVLNSPSGGLITRFDDNGSGSGTINLQAAGITQANLQGSYAFGVAGTNLAGTPLGAAGAFTLDVNGNATGTEDFNDDGDSDGLTALPLTSGSVLVGAPGTAHLTASAGTLSSLGFDVWVIDSTHLKLIETDSTAILAGDAFVSTQTAFPSGPLVFTMLGSDITDAPLAMGGLLTSTGSGISTGLEDINDAGSVGQAPVVTGSLTPFSGGRTQLTLDGIFNGGWEVGAVTTPGNYAFAAYPYNGGIELLEIDSSGGITAGAAYPQTPSSLGATQGYALNLTGSNDAPGEADMIAEFVTTSSGGFSSGLYDTNNLGLSPNGLVSDLSLGSSTGTYSNDSNGDGRGTVSFPNPQINNNSLSDFASFTFTFYTINSSSIVFIETDADQLGLGTLQLQNASGSAGVMQPAFSMVPPAVRAHGALRKKK